jgi:bacterioferritin-associated ferredoxin
MYVCVCSQVTGTQIIKNINQVDTLDQLCDKLELAKNCGLCKDQILLIWNAYKQEHIPN